MKKLLLRFSLLTFLVILSVSLLSGCILAPSIGSVQKAGITESGRKQTLGESVKSFNTALFWENYPLANSFAAKENIDNIKVELQKKRSDGRVVESKIENIVFNNDAYIAEVDVLHRVQSLSTNIVSPITEKQEWVFSLYDGWRINALSQDLS